MSDPTPLHELNAISLLCQREGILKDEGHTTTLGQVMKLLARATCNEADAARYRQEFQDARLACYSLTIQTGQLESRLREHDERAEKELEEVEQAGGVVRGSRRVAEFYHKHGLPKGSNK